MFSICLKNSVTMLVLLKKYSITYSDVQKQISNQNLTYTISPVSMYLHHIPMYLFSGGERLTS